MGWWMSEGEMNLRKKKKERDFMKKKGRWSERKGFGAEMIENREEMRGD